MLLCQLNYQNVNGLAPLHWEPLANFTTGNLNFALLLNLGFRIYRGKKIVDQLINMRKILHVQCEFELRSAFRK